ncbi:RNA-directed DNA polymerase-like protein [Gossypium australe]|uniref:RNA-directed DNA polymerase-like protein n=1 Tax=Gossypium australe TaxID=47621 RepID=A0A5B6V4D3_9ROSI|nr:RNA-directed DNA polymerase-like protein [Gossypium australe]
MYFLKNYRELPSECEIEFVIGLMPETVPISTASYQRLLKGVIVSSKIDLRFNNNDVSETTVGTCYGHYEFLVMFFGITNALLLYEFDELGFSFSSQLYAKFNKYELWLRLVGFLSHVVSMNDISIDPSKISKIVKWKAAKNVQRCVVFWA